MDPKDSQRSATVWDLAGLFLVLAMVLWFTDEIVRAGKVPFYRDLGPYFYPMRFNLAMSFLAGELPLWNRHVAMGFPLAANIQAGAFYPPHLVFVVLPFLDAIRALYVFHFLVAAIGAYVLCRQWTYPPYLAVIGSALFTFGGVIVSLTNLLDHFQTAVWLPWVLLFAERAIVGRSAKDFLFFTCVSLMQFLAGSPEIYLLSLAVLFLRAVELRAESPAIRWRDILVLIFGANALVVGLAMVQILPTLELYLHSWRSETLPLAKGTVWSLPPRSLLNLFFLDKESNPYAFDGINLFFTHDRPLILSLYLGAIALPGVCLWLLTSPLREKCLLSVAIALVLALGGNTFVYPFLFQYVPGFSLVRFPEKFLFLVSALLLAMALRGLHRSLGEQWSLSLGAWLAAALVPVLGFILLYIYLRLHLDPLIQFIAGARHSSPFEVSTLQISAGVLVHLERQLFLLVGFLALLLLFKVRRLRAALFGPLLAVLVFFDLGSAHRPYLFPLSPESVFRAAPIIEAPDGDPSRLFYNHHLTYLHPVYYRFSLRPFAGTLEAVHAILTPNTGVFRGFDYMQELDALGRKPYHQFLEVANELPPEKLYRLLGCLNVKYVVSLQALPPGDITLLRHLPEYPAWLYRVDRWVPRAYIVPKAAVAVGARESLTRLSSAEFDPLREVLVEDALPISPSGEFESQAGILSYTNRSATIRASLNQPGILVLADSFYPGWRVQVDGKEGKILRANFFFRGVLLSPGIHLVEFKYQPRWFQIGLSVSLASAALAVLVAFQVLRRRRRRAGIPV